MSDRPTIFINVQSGRVDSVHCDDPALQGAQVVILDEDTETCPEREVAIQQNDGAIITATVESMDITPTYFDAQCVLAHLD